MIPKKIRWTVLYRDNFTCQLCGWKGIFRNRYNQLHDKGLEVDLQTHHIQDHSHNYDNLIALCWDCHFYKVHNGDWRNKSKIVLTPIKTIHLIVQLALKDLRERERHWNRIGLVDVSNMGASLAKNYQNKAVKNARGSKGA